MAGGHPVSAIGASGGVFGVLVYYTLRFPHRRFVIRLPALTLASAIRGSYVVIPSAMFIVIFVAKEMVGLASQIGGSPSHIGHIAHLCGGIVGLFIFLVWGPANQTKSIFPGNGESPE
jgi:membrane associated rhomboid family serine protease